MMMAQSSSASTNEHLSMSVLGSGDRIAPVRASGSLRQMRDRPHRQRQNSRTADTCLFLVGDDEQSRFHHHDTAKHHPDDHHHPRGQEYGLPESPKSPHQEYMSSQAAPPPPPSSPSLREVYESRAVKQMQSELRHIVERALKDPSNDAAQVALERKHQEMETLVQTKVASGVVVADDDSKVNYYRGGAERMKLLSRRPLLGRRVWTDGSVPLGKSI